jgi:hypothetical protein
MIADASTKRFQAILVWDLSRLGRYDIVEGGFWMKPLRDAGVKVVTLDCGEIDWNDFAARILWSIQQEGKHAFLRDLSRASSRGRLEVAKRGERIVKAPYGYRKKGRKLVPGLPEEVKTVQRIFRAYSRGTPLRQLSRMLNEEGLPSATGAFWNQSSLDGILHNRTYLGETVFNTRKSGRYSRVRGGEVVAVKTAGALPEWSTDADLIVCRGTHKPLIDQATFDAVQSRFRNYKARYNPSAPMHNALAGFVRCGYCGRKMHGKCLTQRGRRSYACDTWLERGPSFCVPNRARESDILSLVIDAIESRVLPSPPGRGRRRVADHNRTPHHNGELHQLREELRVLEDKVAHAEHRLLKIDFDLFDIAQREYRLLRSQRTTAFARLLEAEAAAGIIGDELRSRADRVTRWLSNLHEAIRAENRPAIRELILEFADHIEVWSVPYRRGKQMMYRLDRAIIHFGESLGSKIVRCPEDIPLPISSNDIPPIGIARRRELQRIAARKRREKAKWAIARRHVRARNKAKRRTPLT